MTGVTGCAAFRLRNTCKRSSNPITTLSNLRVLEIARIREGAGQVTLVLADPRAA